VHAPALVRPCWRRRYHTQMARPLLTLFGPHAESLALVEAVNPLVVYLPAFSLEQHRESPVPVSPACLGELAKPHPERPLFLLPRPVGEGGALEQRQPACSTGADAEAFDEPA